MVLDLDQGGRFPQAHRTYLGPSLGWVITDEPTDIEFLAGSSVTDVAVGFKGYLLVPEWLVVQSWIVIGDAAGSIEWDIWKVSLDDFIAGTIPSAANSITGSQQPKLTGQSAATADTLFGWTILLAQNDVLAFNIKTCSGIKRSTLIIRCIRSLGVG